MHETSFCVLSLVNRGPPSPVFSILNVRGVTLPLNMPGTRTVQRDCLSLSDVLPIIVVVQRTG